MNVEAINALAVEVFADRFAPLFEHSPWVAGAAARLRPFPSIAAMEAAMMEIVLSASHAAQLALLNAHPELAGARVAAMSLASVSEQAEAGLDRLAATEAEQFDRGNRAYRARFGFPFIICVRLNSHERILQAMTDRLHNSAEQEIATALAEVGKIAHLRLKDMLRDGA